MVFAVVTMCLCQQVHDVHNVQVQALEAEGDEAVEAHHGVEPPEAGVRENSPLQCPEQGHPGPAEQGDLGEVGGRPQRHDLRHPGLGAE